MSTFQGLEVAKKALFAQQSALYTTGHNIANVNTKGYSRQRVNFETTSPFPYPSRVQPQIPGQIGTGVQIGAVQRIRDKFLDMQFRAENSRLGYWETKQEALSRMENLLNEPSESGLSSRFDLFWQALQDLADHPENSGARAVVAQRGLAVAETFNYLSLSLQEIQKDLKEQINYSIDDINSLLRQINDINQQIQKIEPHGFLANDLYDERDRLIDELSQYMNIKVHRRDSSDSALDIADGIVSIEVVQDNGMSFPEPIFLIDAENYPLAEAVKEIKIEPEKEYTPITSITIDGQIDENGNSNLLSKILNSSGRLSALMESYGYQMNGEVIGDFPEVMAELDKMAQVFAREFNNIHSQGINLEPETDADGNLIPNGGEFFVIKEGGGSEITAENITVRKEILDNPDLIAAGDPANGRRNGDNALELANLFDKPIGEEQGDPNFGNASIRQYYISLIGQIGVWGQEAETMRNNTEILQMQIDHSRMSVSAVSLDEEISNLVKFQHAYNAAARNMTAIDEMIDRIINHMGLVGR